MRSSRRISFGETLKEPLNMKKPLNTGVFLAVPLLSRLQKVCPQTKQPCQAPGAQPPDWISQWNSEAEASQESIPTSHRDSTGQHSSTACTHPVHLPIGDPPMSNSEEMLIKFRQRRIIGATVGPKTTRCFLENYQYSRVPLGSGTYPPLCDTKVGYLPFPCA